MDAAGLAPPDPASGSLGPSPSAPIFAPASEAVGYLLDSDARFSTSSLLDEDAKAEDVYVDEEGAAVW